MAVSHDGGHARPGSSAGEAEDDVFVDAVDGIMDEIADSLRQMSVSPAPQERLASSSASASGAHGGPPSSSQFGSTSSIASSGNNAKGKALAVNPSHNNDDVIVVLPPSPTASSNSQEGSGGGKASQLHRPSSSSTSSAAANSNSAPPRPAAGPAQLAASQQVCVCVCVCVRARVLCGWLSLSVTITYWPLRFLICYTVCVQRIQNEPPVFVGGESFAAYPRAYTNMH